MVDVIGLAGLFAELFPATKRWREPKVERVGISLTWITKKL